MPFPSYLDRRRSMSTSTGTGNMVLALGTGPWLPLLYSDLLAEPFDYCIAMVEGDEWETGSGHLTEDGELVRDMIMYSSAGGTGTPVDFPAGNKEVFLVLSARRVTNVVPIGLPGGVVGPGTQYAGETSDDTPLQLAPPINQAVDSSTAWVELTVLARTAAGDCKVWRITYLSLFDGVDTTLVDDTVEVLTETSSLPWTVTIGLDGSNHQVECTGEAATEIDWRVAGTIKAWYRAEE